MPREGFVTCRGFEAHLNNVYTEPNTGCWLWAGAINHQGYGLTQWLGKQKLAHRVSYNFHKGNIPEGLVVMHKCDVPLCVNPDHLMLGSQVDNIKDMHSKGRRNYKRSEPVDVVAARPNYHDKKKLTPEQVIVIYHDKRNQKVVANEFGISQTMVSRIQLRKVWRLLLSNEIRGH